MVTKTSMKAILLQQVPCIWYQVYFQEDKVEALIDSEIEINVMTPVYIVKLNSVIQKTDIGT